MNLIAFWFTSSDLERDKYGVAATLFTDDFLEGAKGYFRDS